MSELITLIARLDEVDRPVSAGQAAGLEVRPCETSDIQRLGRLYFEAYDPGVACDSREEALADIEASLRGAYGDFWFQASPVVEVEGRIVSAVMTVHRAPWNDIPDCPFIIELFTARDYRRKGLAQLVLDRCLITVMAAGESAVALRVDRDNAPARRLYESFGFIPWPTSPASKG